MSIKAVDNGIPIKEDEATILINVQRNLNKPKFEENLYTATIEETEDVGYEVTQVLASDVDGVSPEEASTKSFTTSF